MNLDRAIVTRLIETQDVRLLLKYKVKPTHLSDDVAKKALSFALTHYERFNQSPSLSLLQEHVPEFEAEECEDDFEALLDSSRDRRLYSDLQRAVKRVAKATGTGSDAGLLALQKEATTISVSHSKSDGEDLARSADDALRQYRKLKASKGLLGIPWPWEPLNRSTRGIRKATMNVLYGPEGTMKTWLLLYIGLHASTVGARPIVFVYEMTVEDVRLRYAALVAGLDYSRFLDGSLTPKEERRLERKLKEMKSGDASFVVEEIESVGDGAVLEMQAKAKEYNSNLILLDGMSFVSDDMDWAPFGKVMRGVKRMAMKTRIPVVGVHHSNDQGRAYGKKGKQEDDNDTRDLALGRSLARDVDVLFRLRRTPQNKEQNEVELITRKVREGKDVRFMINALPAKDFSTKFSPDESTELEGSEDEF